MANVAIAVTGKSAPASFTKIHLVHARVDEVEKMSFDEFQKRTAQMFKNKANPAMRYFNRLDEDFKFCVLTLANREEKGAFSPSEIGKPFEYFDAERRKLIINAMNKISRWGTITPRQFSTRDCFINK